MEDKALVDMYRGAWDSFLEAYKAKLLQMSELAGLIQKLADCADSEEDKQTILEQLNSILEK